MNTVRYRSIFDAGFRPELKGKTAQATNPSLATQLKTLLVEDQMAPRSVPVPGRLSYLPWVGAGYLAADAVGAMTNRVIFVAESNYKDNANWDFFDYINVRLAEFIFDEKDKNKTYQKFFDIINPFGQSLPLSEARKRVFERTAFMNICQRCMDGVTSRPNKADFISGWRTWFETVRVLKPTLCVCNGVASADERGATHFNDAMLQLELIAQEAGVDFNYIKSEKQEAIGAGKRKVSARTAVVTIGGNSTDIIWIKHTARPLSALDWRRYLEEEYSSPNGGHNPFKSWFEEMVPP